MRNRIAVFIALIISTPITAGTLKSNDPIQPPAGRIIPLAQQIGRYLPIQPQGSGYENFLWVVDTATGEIRGYRFAQASVKNSVWITERLWNEGEYVQFLQTQKDTEEPQPTTQTSPNLKQ